MRWKRRLRGGSTKLPGMLGVLHWCQGLSIFPSPLGPREISEEVGAGTSSYSCSTLSSLNTAGLWLLELRRCPAHPVSIVHLLVQAALIRLAAPAACANSLQNRGSFLIFFPCFELQDNILTTLTTEIHVSVMNCCAILVLSTRQPCRFLSTLREVWKALLQEMPLCLTENPKEKSRTQCIRLGMQHPRWVRDATSTHRMSSWLLPRAQLSHTTRLSLLSFIIYIVQAYVQTSLPGEESHLQSVWCWGKDPSVEYPHINADTKYKPSLF